MSHMLRKYAAMLFLGGSLVSFSSACQRDAISPVHVADRSIADGVTATDSLAWQRRSRKAIASRDRIGGPRLDTSTEPSHIHCGASEWTLPNAIKLFPTDVESSAFVTDPLLNPIGHAFNFGSGNCPLELSVAPASQLFQSGFPDYVQEAPVEIELSAPVSTALVYGSGAVSCDPADQGSLVALDNNGTEVGSVPLRLRDSADCGADRITFGVWGSVSTERAVIRRLIVQGPTPWTFRSNYAEDGIAFATQHYVLILTIPIGPLIEIRTARDTIIPTVSHYSFNPETHKYRFLNTDTSRVSIRLSVKDAVSNEARANVPIHLELIAHEATSGHLHSGGKPAGGLSRSDVVSDNAGNATVSYYAPEAAGVVTIRATVDGAEDTTHVHVMIRNLTSLTAGANYYLTGQVAGFHTDNHYMTSGMRASLIGLADSLRRRWGDALGINDVSLEHGGLFEDSVSGPWSIPHAGHRLGTGADIRSRDWGTTRTRQVMEVWDSCYGHAVFEGNHIHLNQTHQCSSRSR